MIRFQIVDLFPKEKCPEIFTDEFDGVQGSLRTRFEDTVAVYKKLFRFGIGKKDERGEGGRGRKVGRGKEREREAYTYRSTRPCPTRYPRPSKRQKTASRVSSLSMWDVVVFAAPVAIEVVVVVVAGALLSIVAAAAAAVLVLGAAGVRSCCCPCCCWCVALLDAGAAAPAAGVVDAEALLRILLLRNSSMRACSRAWSWSVMR